jgi:mxaD protein
MLLSGILISLSTLPAAAHGPTPQKISEKIVIASPPAEVWALAGEFAKIDQWHPLVQKSAGGGNAAGSERTITLKSGGDLVEGLDEYKSEEMSYAYRLSKENIEAFPVSFYSAALTVKPAEGGGSEIEWSGRFYRADTSNFPPENLNDAAAIAAMENFFRQGLEGLKAKLEASK